MAININRAITQSLQKQLDQVAMQQNENKNVMEGELLFASDATKFHTLERIEYTMPRIPKIEERPAGYNMLIVAIMDPQEAFVGKMMKQSSVQVKLPMRAKLPEVELEEWGDNAPNVNPIDL
jgi:hypothetical protein